MSTKTTTMPSQEYTAIKRVASIPLVQYSLETVVSLLNSHSVTRYGYCTAVDVSSTVIKYTEPHVAPILVRADGYANQAVDSVQGTFPAAFATKPEDITNYVKGQKENVNVYVAERRENATKVIDEKVKTPVVAAAEGVDRSCTKFVDALEAVVTKFNSEDKPATPIESKYQYQRALALSKCLRDNVYGYSTEQWRDIQAHNAYVQAATETANNITTSASSSIASVQQQVQLLSNKMISELQQIRASTLALASSLQATTVTTISTSTEQLHAQRERFQTSFQTKWTETSDTIGSSIADITTILKDDLPMADKVAKLAVHVQDTVKPILTELGSSFRSRTSTPTQEEPPKVNGVGDTH